MRYGSPLRHGSRCFWRQTVAQRPQSSRRVHCVLYLFSNPLPGARRRARTYEPSPGPQVLVSNHTSYFDVLVLMAALGVDYHFVAKKEVHDMPFIGTFLRKLEHFCL